MAKPNTDWESIEREYRAGQLSLSTIGEMYGVSKGRISQKAKEEGWTQDLGSRIRARAEAKLNEKLINAQVNAESKALSDDERVAVGAEALANIIGEHQVVAKRLRTRVAAYELELDSCGEELGEKAKILKMLSDTAKSVIAIERQAYGIGDGAEADKTEDKPLAPNDAARRIAFLFTQATRS